MRADFFNFSRFMLRRLCATIRGYFLSLQFFAMYARLFCRLSAYLLAFSFRNADFGAVAAVLTCGARVLTFVFIRKLPSHNGIPPERFFFFIDKYTELS